MGGYAKFIVLGTLIIGMTIGMFSALYSFQDVSQRITAHTTLSAWSLAQLELEYQKLCTELQLYRAGKSSAENLSLAYDLAWNRMDVFLHGSESAVVRSQFGAAALIQKTFEMLQQHEAIIEKACIEIIKQKKDKSWLSEHGITPKSNAKLRREQILEELRREKNDQPK